MNFGKKVRNVRMNKGRESGLAWLGKQGAKCILFAWGESRRPAGWLAGLFIYLFISTHLPSTTEKKTETKANITTDPP